MKTIKRITVEELVFKMLKENTGVAMMDSGGDNGRMWQRNAKKTLRDFCKEPEVRWDGDSYTISLFHYLVRGLKLDAVCHEFNSRFVPAKDWDSEWYGVSQAGEEWLKDREFLAKDSFNSYNGESALSQVIQGQWLEWNGGRYLLLQIHGGADVRGGYTDARLFHVPDYEEGVLMEDVYGTVEGKDGVKVQIDNRYNGVSLTHENGAALELEPGDKVTLHLG